MNKAKVKSQRTRLGWSILIALGLVSFGVLANWYLVMESIDQVNGSSDTVAGLHINPYQELYDELLKPSVLVSTPSGTGSGVVIASGVMRNESETQDARPTTHYVYILSAAHVVGDESEVTVKFYHQDTKTPSKPSLCLSAFVVITDTLKDLALIKAYTYKPYPYVAKLAPRNYTPYIFTPVWVVGCSLGYEPRPTSGEIASATPRNDREPHYWGINAPIWPGNSGGGVFLQDTRLSGGQAHELIGIAILVKVYQGQLVSTMGSIVTLQDIYEFINSQAHRFTGPAVTHELVESYRELKDSKKGGD